MKTKNQTRRQDDKEKGRKAPEAETWTPDQSIPNPKHERFAQLLIQVNEQGGRALTQVEAYAAIYGKHDRGHACRLAAKGNIAARVKWLQEQVAAAVVEEVGVTKIGLAKRLLEMLDTPPTDVLDAVEVWALAKERDEAGKPVRELSAEERAALNHKLKQATGIKAGQYGYEVKLSEKAGVAMDFAKLMGWMTDSIEVKGKLEVDFNQAMAAFRAARQRKIEEREGMRK